MRRRTASYNFFVAGRGETRRRKKKNDSTSRPFQVFHPECAAMSAGGVVFTPSFGVAEERKGGGGEKQRYYEKSD